MFERKSGIELPKGCGRERNQPKPDATVKTTGERVQVLSTVRVWGQPGLRVMHADGEYRDWHRAAIERDTPDA